MIYETLSQIWTRHVKINKRMSLLNLSHLSYTCDMLDIVDVIYHKCRSYRVDDLNHASTNHDIL